MVSGPDLTFLHDLRQIRVAVQAARPSVRARAADVAYYSGRNALAVVFQTARGSAKAFEQGMYRKSARLQQRRRAGGLWLAARADKGWSGCAVLGNGKAHLGELASPPPPAQCAAVRARAMPLVHGAASPLAAPCVWQEAIRSCHGSCFR